MSGVILTFRRSFDSGIMTNDFHQLAVFVFQMEYRIGENTQGDFLYILGNYWIVIFCAMILVIAISFQDVRFHKIAENLIPMIPLESGECTQLYIKS